MSCVRCHMSPVTCHWRQQPYANAILPLLTPPLCTVWGYCWSWPRSINNEWKRPKLIFFCAAIFNHFWAKSAISENNVIFSIFLKDSFAISLLYFQHLEKGVIRCVLFTQKLAQTTHTHTDERAYSVKIFFGALWKSQFIYLFKGSSIKS